MSYGYKTLWLYLYYIYIYIYTVQRKTLSAPQNDIFFHVA